MGTVTSLDRVRRERARRKHPTMRTSPVRQAGTYDQLAPVLRLPLGQQTLDV